jgi:hypothetical protein
MAQILEFVLKGQTFSPDQIALMQRAYGAALDALSMRSAPDPARLSVAELVVRVVTSGRASDPDRLSALVVEMHRSGRGLLDAQPRH